MKRVKVNPIRGSHLPVLIKIVNMTQGPILELGSGMYSTPFLHWACLAAKRKLVTYESSEQFFDYIRHFQNDYHDIKLINDYHSIDLSDPWQVVFIDHSPDEERIEEIKRLTHAEYVICHDAEKEDKYHYSQIMNLFKYNYLFSVVRPHTLVLSNKWDLNNFSICLNETPPRPEILKPIGHLRMQNTYPGDRRRYTICMAIREVYAKIRDKEDQKKLRYACTLAEYITNKLGQYNPYWLRNFYPRRQDFEKVMDK